MAVTELWTGSAISRSGSLLYIFIAANASPTVGFLSTKKRKKSLKLYSEIRYAYNSAYSADSADNAVSAGSGICCPALTALTELTALTALTALIALYVVQR